jgi:hypothetical protein
VGGSATICVQSQSTVPLSMPCLLCRAHRELRSVLRPVVLKSRAHVAVTTKFCTLAHNISGSSVGNLLRITHITLLAPRILTWLMDFRKSCATLTQIRSRVPHAIRFWRTVSQWHYITARRCGAPPDFNSALRDVIDRKFPRKRIGRSVHSTQPFRCLDLIPLDFVFWGYIRDAVYVPLLPTNLPELGGRGAAAATVTPPILANVSTELHYRHAYRESAVRRSCNLTK